MEEKEIDSLMSEIDSIGTTVVTPTGEEFDVEAEIARNLRKAEEAVKAVWEIDGVTIYIRDITVHNKKIGVDWFTLAQNIDNLAMGIKVEELAKILLKEQENKECQSSTRFSRILSTMKNIFGSRGRI